MPFAVMVSGIFYAMHGVQGKRKRPLLSQRPFGVWCPGEDSNLHGVTR